MSSSAHSEVPEASLKPNKVSVALTEAIKKKFDVVRTREREERERLEKIEWEKQQQYLKEAG